jgi:phosphatidylserine/phosphatidylglycerophosphate/cardiolipin synthase-like enzyme
MNQPLTFAAARRHRPERAANLLVPGRNCWRIERARKLSWLVDGEQYFSAVRTAMANAQSTIFIVGWDIDSRVKLVPTGANDGLPDALGTFWVRCSRRGHSSTLIFSAGTLPFYSRWNASG